MSFETVAVVAPGDMGHAVGGLLVRNGQRVVTCLAGRSPRSKALAEAAGLVDLGDDATLVREADVLLSIIPPSDARSFAERIARAVDAAGTDLLFADCNATAPETAKEIEKIVTGSGASFVDATIIGPPPKGTLPSLRFYVSGEHAARFAALSERGLDIRVVGEAIGQASAVKMCYAAVSKALVALSAEALTAGRALGVEEPLRAELALSQATLLNWFEKQVPVMPPKAYRWVGEMEEIAKTFSALGMTPAMLQGAADMFRFIEKTPLGRETPETRSRGTTLAAVVETLASSLNKS